MEKIFSFSILDNQSITSTSSESSFVSFAIYFSSNNGLNCRRRKKGTATPRLKSVNLIFGGIGLLVVRVSTSQRSAQLFATVGIWVGSPSSVLLVLPARREK